ncbi:voltage-dependent anion channel [Dipodascopsis uninucleata]
MIKNFNKELFYRVKYFSPAWFGMVMGISGSAGILLNYPFPARWLHRIGIAYWGLGAGLQLLFLLLTVLRFCLYRETVRQCFMHPMHSLVFGCVPISIATTTAATLALFEGRAAWVCYIVNWFNIALCFFCAWVVTMVSLTHHKRTDINASIIFPAATFVVTAATTSAIAKYMPDKYRGNLLLIALIMWGHGVFLSSACACVYLWRMFTGLLPKSDAAVTAFLPIGPFGQGAYGLILLSEQADMYFLNRGYSIINEFPICAYIGAAVGCMLVGFAFFWMIAAVYGCLAAPPKKFGVAWWAFTFPVATVSFASGEIGRVFDSLGFKIFSAIVGTTVVLIAFVLLLVTFQKAVLSTQVFDITKAEVYAVFPPEEVKT